ncbi:LysR family transcriptional regulator [Conexibacter woesei]|uniref:LysR family transcriptional regulator n=1 Tax=Conexibacter woesei TaxID=191495 RepID=UPI0004159D99|nr:LysR family transcriptional regulator [Conexibacter woesei]
MNTEELRWFAALAERPHMTAVAKDMHISQPALSRAIGRLEAQLGVELFDRRGRVVALNHHGRRYLAYAQRALDELDAGAAALSDLADAERGELRLWFLHTLGSWMVPALVGAFREDHPNVRFRLAQRGGAPLVEALDDGEADLLMMGPRPAGTRWAWHPLVTEPLLLAVPPNHPLAGRRSVWLREVAREPFVTLHADTALRAVIDDLCRRAGFEPRVAFEGDEVATLRGLVAAGLGVALIPPQRVAAEEVTTATPHLRVRDEGAERELGMVWDPERSETPVVRGFREFVLRSGRKLCKVAMVHKPA